MKHFGFIAVCICLLPYGPSAFSTAPNETARWNAPQDRQACNNCYNYATNQPNGTVAQPGWASGIMNSSPYTCGGLLAGAEGDGLTFAGRTKDEAETRCPSDCCLVALVLSDGDYHWYREDSDGTWSHKPGGNPAMSVDAGNQLITDPTTANHNYGGAAEPARNYHTFCGFMCVCQDDLMPLEGRKPPKPIPADWYDGCPPNACHETPPNLNFPGCLLPGTPSDSPCVCCSCVLRITNPAGGGECR